MSNRREQNASQDLGSSIGSSTATAIDPMIRWPFWFTGASMDLMLQGMQRMTGQADRTMGSEDTQANDSSGSTGTSGTSMNFSTSGGGSNWSRVERRLPKEELEVTRIERVTIEHGVDAMSSVA
jgi:hypothetical protein